MRSVQAMASSQPPPQCVSVDRRNDGLAEILDQAKNALPVLRRAFPLDGPLHGQLVDIRPRDEGFLARAGEDDHADLIILGDGGENIVELLDRRRIERVQLVRPVDRDIGDTVALFIEHILVGHRSSVLTILRIEEPIKGAFLSPLLLGDSPGR